ncbi:hypothetical protein [Arthrobacter sp. MYb213]|uniref:hypothetical protein n=1 Tax=Arthrobacter sp. MYb213 TaxID=1848595 RepID=UPI000CFCD297|nr:hypothetical protein [Arthrobacter sp. MYb213]PRB69507.1 hypothetical protein CQ011_12150 [Arthrobacter sp. MYb213]
MVHAVARGDLAAPTVGSGSLICLECQDRIQSDLRTVVNRWAEAQEALHPGSGGGGSERRTPRLDPPAPVRLEVVDALKVTSDRVWKLVVAVVDHYADVRLPDDQTTPGLAEWLSMWMVPKLASIPSAEEVLRCYWWVAEAVEEICEVTEGATVTVVAPDQCRAVINTEGQGQAVCGGEVKAVRQLDGRGDAVVQCVKDSSHWMPFANWQKQMAARKPRRARPRKLG